jgi:hypothetical protein
VRWSYEKDENEASGEDALFVDQLSVVPAAADLRISQGGGPVISPWTVDFGSVLERAAFVDQILTLSNQGNLPMTLSLSLPVGSGFELLNAPSRLEPNQVVDVTVRMLTSTVGEKATFLAINAPGSATPPPLVQLTGNVLPKVAVFELTQAGSPAASGSTYALGNLPQTISFTIRNAGTDVLRPVATVLSGEVNILNSPTSEIAPGDSSTLVLLFSPGSSGSKTAEISIQTNDLIAVSSRDFESKNNKFDIICVFDSKQAYHLKKQKIIPDYFLNPMDSGTSVKKDEGGIEFDYDDEKDVDIDEI